jgi:DNA invertase Pin-like site-specific DNA recombinase
MKRAYSIIRFSSWKQIKGQSRRRQAEWSAAWCNKHGYRLDESLKSDKPVSAFRGANTRRGALAAFLEMVQLGRVPKGSILLVESLDRLSRQEVDEAFVQFQGILKSGIDIVTMIPERHYTKASVGDITGILEPLLIMSRANEESKIKSERILDVWQKRRKEAQKKPEKGKAPAPMNGNGPGWLQLVDGRWEPIPKHVTTVKRIFQLAIDGHGLHSICQVLNREGVPTVGRASLWQPSYVGLVLRNRAVLGECQPHQVQDNGKRVAAGNPIQGYYPAVIDEATFYQAEKAVGRRKHQRGPRGKGERNLFTGLLRSALDGYTMVTITETNAVGGPKLVSSGALRGKSSAGYRTLPYQILEDVFLRFVRELKASDVLPRAGVDAEDLTRGLSAKLQSIDHRLTRLTADLQGEGDFDAGLELLRQLEKTKKETSEQLERARAEQSTTEAEILGESQSLIDLLTQAEGEERLALRIKLKQRIRELVSEMWLLVVPRGWAKLVALQIYFGDGNRRDILLYYQPASRSRPTRWHARSLADVAKLGPLDLRKPAHAARLEAALGKLDLTRLTDG